MTPDRECKAKPTDLSWWVRSVALILLALTLILNKVADIELKSRVTTLEELSCGGQEDRP